MKKVRQNFINSLVFKFDNGIPFYKEEKGLFFSKNKNSFVACKNLNGECDVEQFVHLWAVYEFLHTKRCVEDIKREDNGHLEVN